LLLPPQCGTDGKASIATPSGTVLATTGAIMTKSSRGRFFEDFAIGQTIHHATPRTVTEGDAALYLALTGSRFPLHCSATMARMAGLPRAPLDELLTFHLAFGRSVPDISANAIANLGYADGRFGALLYPGDTLLATSEVIGIKENSSGKTGNVWVRTHASKDDGRHLLDFVRWVMVNKRAPESPAPQAVIPTLPDHVAPERLVAESAWVWLSCVLRSSQPMPPRSARPFGPPFWNSIDLPAVTFH
jgi:2-methylfumaryl-CoA hydratase